jgi:hypothetical protein
MLKITLNKKVSIKDGYLTPEIKNRCNLESIWAWINITKNGRLLKRDDQENGEAY